MSAPGRLQPVATGCVRPEADFACRLSRREVFIRPGQVPPDPQYIAAHFEFETNGIDDVRNLFRMVDNTWFKELLVQPLEAISLLVLNCSHNSVFDIHISVIVYVLFH